MFNLKNLPAFGVVRVYATANKVTEESAALGDYAESGYVDRIGSTDIYQSRNDVAPVWELRVDADGKLTSSYSEYISVAEAIEDLESVIEELDGHWTDGGSTLYGTGSTRDMFTGDDYSYALHAHVKYRDVERGYVEDDVAIV